MGTHRICRHYRGTIRPVSIRVPPYGRVARVSTGTHVFRAAESSTALIVTISLDPGQRATSKLEDGSGSLITAPGYNCLRRISDVKAASSRKIPNYCLHVCEHAMSSVRSIVPQRDCFTESLYLPPRQMISLSLTVFHVYYCSFDSFGFRGQMGTENRRAR